MKSLLSLAVLAATAPFANAPIKSFSTSASCAKPRSPERLAAAIAKRERKAALKEAK